jgi:hypothetical protein
MQNNIRLQDGIGPPNTCCHIAGKSSVDYIPPTYGGYMKKLLYCTTFLTIIALVLPWVNARADTGVVLNESTVRVPGTLYGSHDAEADVVFKDGGVVYGGEVAVDCEDHTMSFYVIGRSGRLVPFVSGTFDYLSHNTASDWANKMCVTTGYYREL